MTREELLAAYAAGIRDFGGANLSNADLSNADLSDADLRGVNLRGARLRGARGLAQFAITPAGALTGYKKLADGNISTLEIPRAAGRVNAYGSRKCRAEFAIVVAGEGVSQHDRKTAYRVGETVRPDSYDPDPRVECSHGIHFFLTREEAEEY